MSFSQPAIYNANQTVLNGDYLINSKNTLAMRYFYTRDPQLITLTVSCRALPRTSIIRIQTRF